MITLDIRTVNERQKGWKLLDDRKNFNNRWPALASQLRPWRGTSKKKTQKQKNILTLWFTLKLKTSWSKNYQYFGSIGTSFSLYMDINNLFKINFVWVILMHIRLEKVLVARACSTIIRHCFAGKGKLSMCLRKGGFLHNFSFVKYQI